MNIFYLVLGTAWLLSLASCGVKSPSSQINTSSPQDYLFATRLDDHLSAQTNEGRTWTQQRVVDLNRYAEALLKEANTHMIQPALAKKGIDNPTALGADTVFIRRTDGQPGRARQDACFWEHKTLGQSTDRDLYYEFHYRTLAEQIEHAVRFLSLHHILMDGYVPGGRDVQLNIQKIELCSVARSNRLMNFNPYTGVLQVSILEDIVGTGYAISTVSELQKYWNFGAQFSAVKSKFALSDHFLVATSRAAYTKVTGQETKLKIWQLINPIGHFRVLMRQMLRDSGRQVVAKIKDILPTEREEVDTARLRQRIETRLLNSRFDLVDQDLASRLLHPDRLSLNDSLASMNRDELLSLLNRWLRSSSSAQNRSQFESALMNSVAGEMNRLSARIKTKITGFIAVGNAHVINVDASLFSAHDYAAFTRPDQTVLTNEADVAIDAEVKGFVAVFTSDVVNVSVKIGSSFGTAGFVEAYESVVAGLNLP